MIREEDRTVEASNEGAPPDLGLETHVVNESYTQGYTQWLIDGTKFIPIGSSTKKLPSGFYHLQYDRTVDKYVPKKKKISIDDLLILPDPILTKILKDIRSFWSREEYYKQYNYVYKRGFLLYGPPGCGKSSVIMLLTKELIKKHSGIVLNIRNSDDVFHFDRVLTDIKEIEPDRKIIAIIEDLDNFVNGNKELLTQLLNILDGAGQVNNLVIIATTNYPENLQERITNRPSRFDRRYEVKKPTDEVRRYYIEQKLTEKDIKGIDIEALVKKTDGFTIDHLKEFLLSVYVLGYSEEDAFNEVKDITKKVLKNTSSEESMGFGTGVKG